MRATVDAKLFSNALDKVIKVLQKSSCVPVLEEALVCFSGGHCILTGTNLDTWLTTEVPAQGDDFSFVFYRTANVAKACRRFDGELTLELTETGEGRDRRRELVMSCGSRTGEFHTLFPEDYPEMSQRAPEYSFAVTANAASLLKRINRVRYATCRPGQNADARSTSVQFQDKRIFCLDGLRAAWDTDETLSVPVPFMLPVTSLEHLKLFGDTEVSVQIEDRSVDFSDGTTHLKSKRVESLVFDLESAIPGHFKEEFDLCPDEWLTELTYLKEVLSKGQKPYVRFWGSNLLTCADGCRHQTRVQVDGRSEMEIGFDLHHMMDALRQFKGESCVRMKLTSPISPIVLEVEGRNDCAMVLPVRLKHKMAA